MSNCYPQTIALPDGSTARVRIETRLVTKKKKTTVEQVVSTPPQYELCDGTPIALVVTIPNDLVAAGWHWMGSFLSNGGIAIFTGTYGLEETFAIARRHQADTRVVETAETRGGALQLRMELA